MPSLVAPRTLDTDSVTIINTIRANAPAQYQDEIPEIDETHSAVKVGQMIVGNPTHSNYFVSALINQVALVLAKSATFNNPLVEFKKGYLDMGETVEEVFVEMAKAREFSVEKAEDREFKRSLPDVRTAFHNMNYRAQYPVSVQEHDLEMAFTAREGMLSLIGKIVDSVYRGAEYDEYLLFKYVIIKGIAHGAMYPVSVSASDLSDNAVKYRGTSNLLQFPSTKFNASGVHVDTKVEDQYIIMDAMYNANYDVNVLASAFNMDKATFSGKLKLVDDWSTFDNDRFSEIIENSDQMELVTDEELAIASHITAVLVDKEWFQFYDNKFIMTEAQVASGLYWNYFLNVWKTLSYSPFSNAVVFLDDGQSIALPNTIAATITTVATDSDANTVMFAVEVDDTVGVVGKNLTFETTETMVQKLVAVTKYGVVTAPTNDATLTTVTLVVDVDGTTYTSGSITLDGLASGTAVTFTKNE